MTNGVLQATDVVKSYNKKEVLHSVSLTIEPGKIYGLIGRNGAGKTTLLSILTAQNTHDSGLVTYNGKTRKHWTRSAFPASFRPCCCSARTH